MSKIEEFDIQYKIEDKVKTANVHVMTGMYKHPIIRVSHGSTKHVFIYWNVEGS